MRGISAVHRPGSQEVERPPVSQVVGSFAGTGCSVDCVIFSVPQACHVLYEPGVRNVVCLWYCTWPFRNDQRKEFGDRQCVGKTPLHCGYHSSVLTTMLVQQLAIAAGSCILELSTQIADNSPEMVYIPSLCAIKKTTLMTVVSLTTCCLRCGTRHHVT